MYITPNCCFNFNQSTNIATFPRLCLQSVNEEICGFFNFTKKEMRSNTSTKKVVIDVRRPEEFAKAHAKGSINIPLQEIPEKLDEIKKIKQPIVVVCGGGTRHVKAFELLKENGIESEKGGGWKDADKA